MFPQEVRRIANKLSYGVTREEIVEELLEDGVDIVKVTLTVKAAELYLKWFAPR